MHIYGDRFLLEPVDCTSSGETTRSPACRNIDLVHDNFACGRREIAKFVIMIAQVR